MRVTAPSKLALLHILANVSPLVRREIFALDPGCPDDEYADVLLTNPLHVIARGRSGEPVASIGATGTGPMAWFPWCFSTPKFPEITLSMTRFVRKEFQPHLARLGMRRAECYSLAANTEAQRWLRAIGGTQEGPAFPFGMKHDPFVRFVWYNPDKSVKD